MSIKPQALAKGDLIGVLAAAGPVVPEEIEPGKALLESRGFRVHASPLLYEKNGYLAGADDLRRSELERMFLDDEIKAVICARGGYGTLRLLERLDFEVIRRHPKIFMGFSDITVLLWAFYHKAGLVTFHGPMVKSLGAEQASNLDSFENLMTAQSPLLLELDQGTVIRSGRASGTLLGGNLSLIAHMIGTGFMPSLKGVVLFLEDTGEALYRIDRYLTHLRLSGLLDHLAGIILGRFEGCEEVEQLPDLFAERLSGLGIPVCSGLPVGHGAENLALPLGVRATLDTERMTLTLEEPWVTRP
ncbi:MAG: LD-carboxypeptidase [Desulfobacteraceae bacterium]|nr:MAG: LD-carboxypeptidase [Desulfobacteraceae bacterium]